MQQHSKVHTVHSSPAAELQPPRSLLIKQEAVATYHGTSTAELAARALEVTLLWCLGILRHRSSCDFFVYTVTLRLLQAALSLTAWCESLWCSANCQYIRYWADVYVHSIVHTVLAHMCVCVSPSSSLFAAASVISVEALGDCADIWLSVHPDLSQNPLPLLQPLGPIQLWQHTYTQENSETHSYCCLFTLPSNYCCIYYAIFIWHPCS